MTEPAEPAADQIAGLRAELARLQAENRAWRSAHGASRIAQIDLDEQGRILVATERAAELLRRDSAESLMGKSLSEVFADGQCEQIKECIAQLDDNSLRERRCMVRAQGRRGRPAVWLRATLSRSAAGDGNLVLVLTDVTDIELSRRELAADVDLFGALLQVAGVEFFEWQHDGSLRSSPGFLRLLGLSADATLPEQLPNWVARLHPDDRGRARRHFARALAGPADPIEFRVIGDDGRSRWVRVAAIVRRDEAGVLACVSGVLREVSAEHESRSHLLRLRSLIDTARAAILMVDGQGRIVLANQAFSAAAGLPLDSVLGSSMDDYCFPEDIEQRRESVRSLLGTGAASFAWRMRCHPGGERWYQVDASTFGDDDGVRSQFVFVGTDIEAARRERVTMIERERWLDRVLRDAGIGAFRLDRSRNEAELVGAYAELMELNEPHVVMPDELLARVLPDHRNRVSGELSRFLSSEARTSLDLPLTLTDGRVRWLRAFLRNEGVYAQHKGVLSSVVFDISEDRRRADESEELQRQIYQAQKTESLGVMAGGIAHDLNNMLMAAIGQLNMAVSAVPVGSMLGRHLGTVESVLGRMEGLTERMLAYAGKTVAQMHPVDVAQLLDSIEPLLRASCGHHVRLRMVINTRPATVLGDGTQIEQVLLNFVQNAVDAIGERSGQVQLRLSVVSEPDVQVTAMQWPLPLSERYLELLVRDDGPGILEDVQRRLFEPFYTTKTTGRGLGLSVVQGIIKAHGGSIRILSEIGIGTEFRVYLPLIAAADEPELSPRQHLTAQQPRTGGAVLAVDDDEDVLAITTVMLEQCGLEVAAFLSGDEAIAELRAHVGRYCCAVVDLTMPVKDGVEVARELRRLVPNLPILFVSGYSKEQAAELVSTDDHTQFLRKPFRMDRLSTAIEQLLRRP
ncbi:MAG: PAS domain-containing protein [Rhodanobacteraceae bacterium]|nr:PAS domain-containing protein [Rhodanobacteraceae bacterium]